ncbi:transmembrane protein 8B [Fopius arisanus]|uniref:Tmem8a_1 protein n=2 Tax=Fopius arisanus TaxID=64838 RepID=A0A0C9QNK5_9HYME|nr:PREDICTED: transmembrane protein 8B-like [Fopius arisanus]XP_011300614.1 PREDICTED: transmembrane protein 8B-like [Fopius arisanus]
MTSVMLKSTSINGLYVWLKIILHLLVLQGYYQFVPETSQEASLHVFKTYNDVATFHYTVPKEVHRATWQFAAFMDGSHCIPREVNIYLQWGSYPIISADNASFPPAMNPERNGTIVIKTWTTHEAETTVVLPVNGPEPGDWFVGAYMTYWDEKVQQQGLGYKCHYSIGSVALWQQVNGIQNIPITQESIMRTTQPSTYYKIFIPSGTWSFNITIWGCKFLLRSGNTPSNLCIKDLVVQGRVLPVLDHTRISIKLTANETYTFEEVTPFEDTYYYLLVASNSIVSFKIKVSIFECPVQITESTLTRRWVSMLTTTQKLGSPEFHQNSVTFEGSENVSSDQCARRFQLIRVKELPTFSGVYLLQGREWLTPWIMLTDASPVIAQFDILPLIDIGGSLGIGVHLEIDRAFMNQTVVMSVCIRRGQMPLRRKGEIVCDDDRMAMRLNTNGKHDGNLLIPYPQPGTWYIGLEARCFNNGKLSKCAIGEILVSLDIRTHRCSFPGSHPCGHYGVCQEVHRNFIHFTTCNCFGGYRGWGCTDSTNVYQQPTQVLSSVMLIVSNLSFIPAIYLAVKRRLYAEALVYLATMVFSALYHACDQKSMTYCIAKYQVLQFSDFFSSILAFWVTLIAMAELPVQFISVCHMLGVFIISFGVEADRTSLTGILVPFISGATIPIGAHSYRCYKTKVWRRPNGVVKLSIGLLLATIGLILFLMIETEANYQYIHSLWHIIIAFSLVFLLPAQAIKPVNFNAKEPSDSDRGLINPTASESPVFTILPKQVGVSIEN